MRLRFDFGGFARVVLSGALPLPRVLQLCNGSLGRATASGLGLAVRVAAVLADSLGAAVLMLASASSAALLPFGLVSCLPGFLCLACER